MRSTLILVVLVSLLTTHALHDVQMAVAQTKRGSKTVSPPAQKDRRPEVHVMVPLRIDKPTPVVAHYRSTHPQLIAPKSGTSNRLIRSFDFEANLVSRPSGGFWLVDKYGNRRTLFTNQVEYIRLDNRNYYYVDGRGWVANDVTDTDLVNVSADTPFHLAATFELSTIDEFRGTLESIQEDQKVKARLLKQDGTLSREIVFPLGSLSAIYLGHEIEWKRRSFHFAQKLTHEEAETTDNEWGPRPLYRLVFTPENIWCAERITLVRHLARDILPRAKPEHERLVTLMQMWKRQESSAVGLEYTYSVQWLESMQEGRKRNAHLIHQKPPSTDWAAKLVEHMPEVKGVRPPVTLKVAALLYSDSNIAWSPTEVFVRGRVVYDNTRLPPQQPVTIACTHDTREQTINTDDKGYFEASFSPGTPLRVLFGQSPIFDGRITKDVFIDVRLDPNKELLRASVSPPQEGSP